VSTSGRLTDTSRRAAETNDGCVRDTWFASDDSLSLGFRLLQRLTRNGCVDHDVRWTTGRSSPASVQYGVGAAFRQ
jgi:hypothetical protein